MFPPYELVGAGPSSVAVLCEVRLGRLTNLRPVVTALAPLVRRPVDAEGHGSEAWRRWYKLARWKRLRIATFVRDLFTCQMPGCGRIEGNTALLVCDHKDPHRGDERLFWNPLNLQTLCKPCHDSKKQREERAAFGIGHNRPPKG